MLNRSASLAMSSSGLKALPSKLDIKRHSPSILYLHGRRHITGIVTNIKRETTETNTDSHQLRHFSKFDFRHCSTMLKL